MLRTREQRRRQTRAGERDSDAAVAVAPDGVQTLSGGLATGSDEIDGAFVEFDARDDIVVAEEVDERDVGGGFLIEGFLEEDNPGEEGEGGGEGFGCGDDAK
ncbi:hypothetical protein U1Q18_010620, partial [Sarracenia purpurea var. burkii]